MLDWICKKDVRKIEGDMGCIVKKKQGEMGHSEEYR
jgi:hypothetical protein